MEERAACALLKRRFETAGFSIAENRAFDEDGLRFEIDGFDAAHRVGYEYITSEAGDSWDVDGDVVAGLAARHQRGDLFILVIDEVVAPDAASIHQLVDEFLADLRDRGLPRKPADEPPADVPPADEPPADEPPADEPPADEPPADEPPADEPPADEPPADEPPADEPPADEPPAEPPKAAKPKPPPTPKPKAAKAKPAPKAKPPPTPKPKAAKKKSPRK